jgi:hypothetical protein
MESVIMWRLFGHVHLVYTRERPFSWRLRDYTNYLHHQVVKMGKSVCPYCRKVL